MAREALLDTIMESRTGGRKGMRGGISGQERTHSPNLANWQRIDARPGRAASCDDHTTHVRYVDPIDT